MLGVGLENLNPFVLLLGAFAQLRIEQTLLDREVRGELCLDLLGELVEMLVPRLNLVRGIDQGAYVAMLLFYDLQNVHSISLWGMVAL